jgi:protein SDA1
MPQQGKAAAMGLSTGKQPLPFGHAPDAAMDIDGLNVRNVLLQAIAVN